MEMCLCSSQLTDEVGGTRELPQPAYNLLQDSCVRWGAEQDMGPSGLKLQGSQTVSAVTPPTTHVMVHQVHVTDFVPSG